MTPKADPTIVAVRNAAFRDKIETERYTLYLADCLSVLPTLQAGSVDAVVTDPPYPKLDYGWRVISPAEFGFQCRQFWFWMQPPEPFPLPFTAMHVWSKANVYIGDCELWEAIYEVNGKKVASVMRESAINCHMNAQMNGDVFYKHPTQKPLKLMLRIVNRLKGRIFDPFMGSGTTGVACMKLGRRFIGIEIDEKYFAIAAKRIAKAAEEPPLFKLAREAEQGILDLSADGGAS